MNLGAVLLAWNLARREAGLQALRVSPRLMRVAATQLSGWTPGTDPEPAYSSYGMVAMIWQGQQTAAQLARAIIAAPYHRQALLGNYSQIGFAYVDQGGWQAVLAIMAGSQRNMPPFTVWIPPQVPAAWTVDEYPQPFGLPTGAVIGWPILIRNTNLSGQGSNARIVGPSGPVPVRVDENFNGSWSLLVAPAAPLAPGPYTLSFDWAEGGGWGAKAVTRREVRHFVVAAPSQAVAAQG